MSGAPVPLPAQGHLAGAHPNVFGPGGYPLAVIWIKNHMNLELHTHDFVELVLILGGTATHRTEHGSYPLSAGDSFVIKPGMPHGYGQTRELELVNILFDPGRLALPVSELSPLPGYHALFELEPRFRARHRFQSRLFLPPAMRRQVATWAAQLEEELRRRDPGYTFMGLALLMRIIGYLCRAYTSMEAPGSQTLLAVNRVVTHLEHNYASPITLRELATLAHMCQRNVQRYFRRAFGVSPIEYLNRLRLQKACELLVEQELHVGEVAERVGIGDSNYFARLFRKTTGVSPSNYRTSSRHLHQTLHPMERGPER